jgi:hypothetical protein
VLSTSSCSSSHSHGLFIQQCLAHRHIDIAFKRQVRPSATRTSLKLGLVSRPALSGRLARLVVALGTIRFACTGRQRASAGPQSRAATPPSLVPRRRTRSQLPSCNAVIASPSASSNPSRESGRRSTRAGRLRQRLLLQCRARQASRWSSEVSGDAVAGATDARRTNGCCCRSSGSLPNAIRRAPPTASASGTHNRSQRFVAVLVLVHQMRMRKVGLAARRHAVTAQVAAL